MKKNILTAYFTFCFLSYTFSQNPLVKQWDYSYGGLLLETPCGIQQTKDGGFIMGGYSVSGVGGDKTQPVWGTNGYSDYWIVKMDSSGNKEWDKNFGGTEVEQLYTLQQTTDGGYILGGWSGSDVSGDKTDSLHGYPFYIDYWIVKIDSFGNKQWDKDFGGLVGDVLYAINQTADGGYILGGCSYSGIGADKSQANWNSSGLTYDYWIIKIDSLGNKQWDKDFGGTEFDFIYSIQQTPDGGYILGGNSNSGISGNKTQDNWDPSLSTSDYWIIKIDSAGNKLWDKVYGGTNMELLRSLQQTSDGGYILGGSSSSGIGGDKSEANWGATGSTFDYWIVKTDSLGNKQWDKTFGGTDDEDMFGNIAQTSDGGYLLAGTSYSNGGGDKSENNTLNTEEVWLVKTYTNGVKQWDKTVHSPGHVEYGYAIQTKDGCYFIASQDNGIAGGEKSQTSWNGSYDYWVAKFCDTTSTTQLPHFLSEESGAIVFPNPASQSTTLDYSPIKEKVISVSIRTILGESVISYVSIPENKIQIPTSMLSKGIYFIELNTGKTIFQKKLIVQ